MRNELPAETRLLLGEPSTMGYEALQNEIGFLIHGETWATETLPKMFAKVGAHLQGQMEIVIPDSIDKGEKPFIKPFMVDLADDHYELDISNARKLLDWEPKHSLRDALPSIIKELKADPVSWYKRNKLKPPEWVETMVAQPEPAERFIESYNRSLRDEHRQNLWAHFLNMAMGTWLMTSPAILGYQQQAMIINDLVMRRPGASVRGAVAIATDGLGPCRQRRGRAVAIVRALGVLDAQRFGLPERYAGRFAGDRLRSADAPHTRHRRGGAHDRARHPARLGLLPVVVDPAHTDHLPGIHRILHLPLSCRLSIGPYRQRLGPFFRRLVPNASSPPTYPRHGPFPTPASAL